MYALCCGTTIAVFASTMTTMSASRMMTNSPPSMGSSLRLHEDHEAFVHACYATALTRFKIRGRVIASVPQGAPQIDTSELTGQNALARDRELADQCVDVRRRQRHAAHAVAEQQQIADRQYG